jgi:two-component system phosphate regulon sensor histidine kinase PhoR
MKTKNFKFIITLITLIILATIGLQVYWNIKNYHENKRQFVIEVVNALDNGIESYYIEDAKNNFIAFVSDSTMKTDSFIDKIRLDTFFNNKGVRKEKAFLPAKKSINHKKNAHIFPPITITLLPTQNLQSINNPINLLISETININK